MIKIRKHHLLKFFLTKLYFNGPFNAQMDKGITSVIQLYQTLSQRPSLKTLQEKWLNIIFSEDQHSVCLERGKKNKKSEMRCDMAAKSVRIFASPSTQCLSKGIVLQKVRAPYWHRRPSILYICFKICFCFVCLCALVAVTLFPLSAFGQPFVLFWHGKNLVFSLGGWGSVPRLYSIRFLNQWHWKKLKVWFKYHTHWHCNMSITLFEYTQCYKYSMVM